MKSQNEVKWTHTPGEKLQPHTKYMEVSSLSVSSLSLEKKKPPQRCNSEKFITNSTILYLQSFLALETNFCIFYFLADLSLSGCLSIISCPCIVVGFRIPGLPPSYQGCLHNLLSHISIIPLQALGLPRQNEVPGSHCIKDMLGQSH